jgi:FMN phosphatase YigB (HAD superfamily)
LTGAARDRIAQARALIFDLDGTLYDTRGFARRLVLSRPREGFLMLADRKTRKGLIGRDYGSPEAYYGEFFSQMAQRTGKPAEILRAWYFDSYLPRMCGVLKRHYRPRPGTTELFASLAGRSFPFAVYSDYPLAGERLSALGLDPAWGRRYGPEHFGAQKPAARPFLSIAAELGVPPGHTLVIGDRDDTDGAGAAAAGMAYIGITGEGTGAAAGSGIRWEDCVALFRDPSGPLCPR